MRVRPLPLFFVLSLAFHATAWVALTRRPAPRHEAAFDTATQTLAGDTLDIDTQNPADEAEAEPEPTPPSPAPIPAPKVVEPGGRTRATERSSNSADAPSQSSSQVAAAPPALFGAAGVRFATDLPTTFTRMFPQVASADSAWGQAPFGSAGTAEVTLVIDDAGHLVSETVGGAPSLVLRQGIDRTLAALKARTFTARAAVTKLRLTARVQRDEVHDGLHGDVFALSGGSFAGEVGTAFFALPGAGGGRRVDVELRAVP